MLSNIPYIMNLFFYNGNIERSILSVQYKSSTLQGSDGRPEIVGKYGYYDPQTGEEEIYFNISSYVKLYSCTLEFNYTLNNIFSGPFTSSMGYVNETFRMTLYYSFWHTKIMLPIFEDYKEFTFIIYQSVLITDSNGSCYKIEIGQGKITETRQVQVSFNLFVILVILGCITLSLVSFITVKLLKRKTNLQDQQDKEIKEINNS